MDALVKNVCCFSNVYLPVTMDVHAKVQTLACCMVMVALKRVFSQRNALNDHSHSTDVTGNVHKKGSSVCMFGNNSLSHSSKA